MIAILCILLVACAPMITPLTPPSNELTMQGLWTGYAITTPLGTFETDIGIKGINIPVLLIYHDAKWYVWNNGYKDIIVNQ